jgi:hypothetical protein
MMSFREWLMFIKRMSVEDFYKLSWECRAALEIEYDAQYGC